MSAQNMNLLSFLYTLLICQNNFCWLFIWQLNLKYEHGMIWNVKKIYKIENNYWKLQFLEKPKKPTKPALKKIKNPAWLKTQIFQTFNYGVHLFLLGLINNTYKFDFFVWFWLHWTANQTMDRFPNQDITKSSMKLTQIQSSSITCQSSARPPISC